MSPQGCHADQLSQCSERAELLPGSLSNHKAACHYDTLSLPDVCVCVCVVAHDVRAEF